MEFMLLESRWQEDNYQFIEIKIKYENMRWFCYNTGIGIISEGYKMRENLSCKEEARCIKILLRNI